MSTSEEITIAVKNWMKPNLHKHLQHFEGYKGTVHFALELDNYFSYKVFANLESDIALAISQGKKVKVSIKVNKKNFNGREWVNFLKFNDYLKANNLTELFFKEHTMLWTIDQVKNAIIKVRDTVREIRQAELSPLEQFLHAFNTVTSRQFTQENPGEDPLLSRSVYGVLNTDKIVCVGYSAWLKSICDKLDNQNIVCHTHNVAVNSSDSAQKSSKETHSANIVYLKDEKYNIEGFYYVDPCWCSKTEMYDSHLAYCLIPVTDIAHLKSLEIIAGPTNPFFAMLNRGAPNKAVIDIMSNNARDMLRNQKMIDVYTERDKFRNRIVEGNEQTIVNSFKRLSAISQYVASKIPETQLIPADVERELVKIMTSRFERKIKEVDFKKFIREIAQLLPSTTDSTCKTLQQIKSDWRDTCILSKQKAYERVTKALDGKYYFYGKELEYAFIKSMCNKLLEMSTVITKEQMEAAMKTVYTKAEKLTEKQANQKFDALAEQTYKECISAFIIPGCKGAFQSTSSDYVSKKHNRISELKKRREEIAARRKNKSIKQTTEPEITLPNGEDEATSQ